MADIGKPEKNCRRLKDNSVDLLISQDTFTALTVLENTGIGSRVGLADCSGTGKQQWTFNGDSIIWAETPSLCLVPDDTQEEVTLADVSTSDAVWEHDDKERIVVDNHLAMHNPNIKPRINVALRSRLDTIRQKWWTSSELYTLLDGATPAEYPVPVSDVMTYKQELARSLFNHLTPVTEPMPYERDIGTFPGIVGEGAPRISSMIMLDLLLLGQPSNMRMTTPLDWQATNLYAAAGDVIEVNLPDSMSEGRAAQITVRVSANDDFLQPTSGNVAHKHQWNRMPLVTETFELSPGVNQIRSQYGGHLIFTFAEGENFTIEVEVKNAVESPYFRLGETTVDDWVESTKKESPRALLEADKVVVVVATKDAANITDPDLLLTRYDEIIALLCFAAGFDDTDPPPRGKYWLANDVQITAGSAHAGFPAMFDRARNDLANIDTPYEWVTWHELGHNFQQMDYWESTYGSESTVNLYSLYIQRQIFDEDRLETDNVYAETADAVDAGLTFHDAGNWEKLVFLMEINYAFPEVGWEMFRQLRKKTRSLSDEEAENLKGDKQTRFDYVYKTLSQTVGSDLIETYNRWSITISQEAQDDITALGLPKAPGDLSHRPSK